MSSFAKLAGVQIRIKSVIRKGFVLPKAGILQSQSGRQIPGQVIAGMQIMHSLLAKKWLELLRRRKKHTNISSVLDGQCKEYARMIKAEHEKYVLKQYGEYKVPFLFATNGRDYIKQYEEMSGIWFLDTRHQFNTSKRLCQDGQVPKGWDRI